MPGPQRSQILRGNALFRRALDPDWLQAAARRHGLVRRRRIVDAVSLFWALVTTVGSQTARHLSDVLRTLNCQQEWSLRYKPFWMRLSKPAFASFMRETFQRLCAQLVTRVVTPDKHAVTAFFSDIFIDDGSSFSLADGLHNHFPGRFTRHIPAAIELHAHMSLFTDQLVSVKAAPDRRGEREFLPDAKQLPRRSLSLRDRGYIDFSYFERLEGTEAFLICRSRSDINPTVFELRGVPRSLARRYRDRRLADIPKRHLAAASEVIVGRRDVKEPQRLRLVVRQLPPSKRRGPRHPRKKRAKPRPSWLYLLTNLPARFSPDDIQRLYRLRWQIELVFKDWKSYANLQALQTENPYIAEGMMWASLCAAFIKRAAGHWAQLVHHRAISTRIAAQLGPQILNALATWASQRGPVRIMERLLEYLAQNAARAHPNRDKLRPHAVLGLLAKV
jgi:hypothetical protein